MEDEWIELGELLRATGMSERKRAFIRWRGAGLILRPQPRPLLGGGRVSKYPPGSSAQLRRVQELENDRSVPRRLDAWLLILWTEGYPVDIRPAVTRLYDNLLEAMSDQKRETFAAVVDAISTKKVKGLGGKGGRGGKLRLLKKMVAKVGDREEWVALVSLIFAAAAGVRSDSSFRYGTVEPAFRGLLKIAAVPKDWEAPPNNLSIDLWAIGYSLVKFLSDLVAPSAPISEDEMERVRVVFARLARLTAAIEGVSLTTLPRHARRTLVAHGVTITQDTIDLALDMWRDIDIRLFLVPGFILILRRAGENVEGWLSLAEAAVAMLPKSAVESPEVSNLEAAG